MAWSALSDAQERTGLVPFLLPDLVVDFGEPADVAELDHMDAAELLEERWDGELPADYEDRRGSPGRRCARRFQAVSGSGPRGGPAAEPGTASAGPQRATARPYRARRRQAVRRCPGADRLSRQRPVRRCAAHRYRRALLGRPVLGETAAGRLRRDPAAGRQTAAYRRDRPAARR